MFDETGLDELRTVVLEDAPGFLTGLEDRGVVDHILLEDVFGDVNNPVLVWDALRLNGESEELETFQSLISLDVPCPVDAAVVFAGADGGLAT